MSRVYQFAFDGVNTTTNLLVSGGVDHGAVLVVLFLFQEEYLMNFVDFYNQLIPSI